LRAFSRIQACAERCRRIMKDMLAFSRQKAGECRPCDVNALLRQCVQLERYDGITDAVDLELDLDETLPAVMLSAGQFQQVIFNLVTNALQALRGAGKEHGRIRLFSRSAEGDLLVSVEDNGPGVPLEAAQKIWEPFYTTKPEGVGTGLGLAICRQIVASQGGVLTLEAAPGGGALFLIRLPMTVPNHRAAAAGPATLACVAAG
jgi:two-component system NtrC family sensor kinase